MKVRSGRARRSGAAAVEAALVLPVFITLVFSMVETARMGQVTQLLAVAARQGARTAALPGKVQSDVQAAVNAVLSGTGVSVGTVSPSPSTWATASGGTLITVSLSVKFSQVSWLNPPMFFGSATLSGSATMSSERP